MYHFLPDHPNQKYRRMNRSIWRSLCSPPQVSGAELEVCNTFWEDDFLYLSFIAKGAANCNVWTPLILQHPSKSAQKLAAFGHSSPGHSSPKTFITPLLNSDVHHLGLSSPPTQNQTFITPTFITSDIHHPQLQNKTFIT